MLRCAAILVALTAPTFVQAAFCAQRELVTEKITQQWGEVRQSLGITRDSVMETWAHPETGDWTITETMAANSLMCIRGVGTDFQSILPEPEGDPA